MATKKPPTKEPSRAVDSRGSVRIYADVPKHIAQEFAVLAVRRDKAKRTLLAELIMAAVAGK